MSEQEDLRLLYQITVSDLAFFKTQQWSVSNYGLLLLGSLVGVTQLEGITSLSCVDKVILAILATIIVGSAMAVLHSLQCSISQRRERLADVRGKLSRDFQDAWAKGPKPSDCVVYFLGVALLLGWALAIGLITFRL